MNPPEATRLEPSRGLQVALLAVAAMFIIVGSIGAMWSGSADVGNHYALVARIAEYWTLPPGLDPSLVEMNVYPRTSHVMAAVAGSLFDSPLIGLQLVSLGSIIVLWASLIHVLQSLPGKLATRTLVAFAVLLVVNRVLLRFEIHGREIVGHFFYAQLVGQAVVAFALVALLAMDRARIQAATRYAVFVAIAWFCAGIHLLPALQLLCLFLLVVLLEFLARFKDGDQGNARRAVLAVAFAVGGIVLLVRHPAFSAMADISRNNGEFVPRHLESIRVIAAYSVFIAIASAAIVLQWFKSRSAAPAGPLLALKYIGLYGMAVAGLCLLQVVALQFGQGSDYAIKKHVFSLNTVMLLELSLVPALLALRGRSGAGWEPRENRGFVYAYLLLPLLTVLAFHAIAPRKKATDTAELVRLERVLQRHREALVARAPGKFVYLLPGPGVSPSVAYMMTIGVLKTPRVASDDNAVSILRGGPISDWNSVGTIVQPGTLQATQPATCLIPFPDLPLAVLDGQCIGRAAAKLTTTIRFNAAGVPTPCTLTGFGDPEPAFTWTTQEKVSIACPIPDIGGRPASSVTLSAGAFLDGVKFQRASISVNGGPAVEVSFDPGTPHRVIALDLPPNSGPECLISIALPDAISPKDAGVSVDARQLGLAVERIEFK